MINIFFILIILIFLISNYIAFIYGIRIGKAMQNDIPPVPVEPATNAFKKAYRLIKDKTAKKSYIQKKVSKQEENFWD